MKTCDELKKLEISGIHPLVYTMLSMDSRICLSPFFGDVDENKGFFITKEAIHIPYTLPTIQHDLSHLLELKNSKRWTLPDWGMARFDDRRMPSSRQFFAAFSREVRTRAIQLHLTQFSCERVMRNSTTYNQLNNPFWDELCKNYLPFGRFKSYQDVDVWMCSMREKTYKAWSLDRIYHEWKIRLSHIQNWMESHVEEQSLAA